MRRALVASIAALVLTGCGGAAAAPTAPRGAGLPTPYLHGPDSAVPVPSDAQAATVVRNVDGDTVVLRGRGVGPLPAEPTKVRLLLIDTPEVYGGAECYGPEASARARQLMSPGAELRVQADKDRTDRYGRTLLHLWTASGANVQQTLLQEGYATVLVVRPNTAYLPQLRAAQDQAREAGAGLWSACR